MGDGGIRTHKMRTIAASTHLTLSAGNSIMG